MIQWNDKIRRPVQKVMSTGRVLGWLEVGGVIVEGRTQAVYKKENRRRWL